MSSRNASSSSTVLVVLALLITFPFWIALGAGLFGVVASVFGVLFGIITAIVGAIASIVTIPFKILFGWGHGWHFWPHHSNGFAWLAIIIIIALVLKSKNKI
jgi:hypothetical protein